MHKISSLRNHLKSNQSLCGTYFSVPCLGMLVKCPSIPSHTVLMVAGVSCLHSVGGHLSLATVPQSCSVWQSFLSHIHFIGSYSLWACSIYLLIRSGFCLKKSFCRHYPVVLNLHTFFSLQRWQLARHVLLSRQSLSAQGEEFLG